jgi:hypothetical protein
MVKSRAKRRTAYAVGALVGVVLACTGLRDDELQCEDAVGHLEQCCPTYVPGNIVCLEPSDCEDENRSYPLLSITDSTCIRGESCAELQSSGVCDRAKAFQSEYSFPGGDAARRGVCP